MDTTQLWFQQLADHTGQLARDLADTRSGIERSTLADRAGTIAKMAGVYAARAGRPSVPPHLDPVLRRYAKYRNTAMASGGTGLCCSQ